MHWMCAVSGRSLLAKDAVIWFKVETEVDGMSWLGGIGGYSDCGCIPLEGYFSVRFGKLFMSSHGLHSQEIALLFGSESCSRRLVRMFTLSQIQQAYQMPAGMKSHPRFITINTCTAALSLWPFDKLPRVCISLTADMYLPSLIPRRICAHSEASRAI
jgi:hypothetical protein